MIDGKTSEFIEKITFQEEAVLYNGKKYFFHGLIYNPDKKLYSFEIHLWDSCDNYVETTYVCTAESQTECMEKLLSEPIIEGKAFWDIEKDMTWIEW